MLKLMTFTGEVANDKWAPLAWEVPMSNQDVPLLWYKYTLTYSKTDVWTLVSVNSEDQLRQRVGKQMICLT